jgi:AcrR family transcriptional regulator
MLAPGNDEARRLATLHGLRALDSEPDPSIDAITASAAALCDVPIALVTLVDQDRQWFKANTGLPETTETARSVAFCDHAIRGDRVLVVNDAQLDERFRDNPLVTAEPHLRFYAGAPLIADNGERIGALCVIDRRPRELDANQIAALARLAAAVVGQLALASARDARRSRQTPKPAPPTDEASTDRASTIVQHAKMVLVEQGAGGFSIRKVAQAAGISLGHLQHYFPTKSDLLNAMVDSLMKSFYRFFRHEVEPVPNPLDRLVACAGFILDQGPDERMVPLLREFWSMATRDPAIADSLSTFYAHCQRFLAEMLTEANPALDRSEIEHRSFTVISLLSGAFLFTFSWSGEAENPGFRDDVLASILRLALDT